MRPTRATDSHTTAPRATATTSRGARVALALALATIAALAALTLSGCARKSASPAEPPAPPPPPTTIQATSTRTMPADLGVGMARFLSQAYADFDARRQLGRVYLLQDEEWARRVRTDEFYRAAFDLELKNARVANVSFDPATNTCEVTVEVEPEELGAALARARAYRESTAR